MATYDSLSQEDKDTLHAGELILRGWWSSVIAAELDLKIQFLTATWKPIKDSLDAGENVPNTSGLGSAQDLTKEDLQTLYADMKAVNDDVKITAKFARLVRAIGINTGS